MYLTKLKTNTFQMPIGYSIMLIFNLVVKLIPALQADNLADKNVHELYSEC